MRILYYDCFAGISGDMNLGALIELGVPTKYLTSEISKLNIDGFHLNVEQDMRRGISGTKATVIVENQDNEKHRHLRHIHEIINNSTLNKNVKDISLDIFQRIAEAEAKVHNTDIQKVHFHEVGALDSIADIVGAAICLDYLKVDKVMSSPIQLGGGTVKCAHGTMPVPAPATALIVEDIPVRSGLVQHEATTPTGAAILAATVDEFSESINFPITKTAYGIGQRDVSEVPNVLRVFLSDSLEPNDGTINTSAVILECNIDDMNPERYEYLIELLMENGADDVWIKPIIMKKLRPANTISIMCSDEDIHIIKDIVFRNTTTLGIREYDVVKTMLQRKEILLDTKYGEIRVKEAYYNGELLRSKPEYDDCKYLAQKFNVSIDEIEKIVISLIATIHNKN